VVGVVVVGVVVTAVDGVGIATPALVADASPPALVPVTTQVSV
jgi:hypothetical protein